MPLVSIDSNVIDHIAVATATDEHVDAMEGQGPPPPFDLGTYEEAEVYACYWLVALAPRWTSVVYTYSDMLDDEAGDAEPHRAAQLRRTAWDVMVREQQQPEHWQVDPSRRPDVRAVEALGVKAKDALHVADAVALGCDVLLTCDRPLRKRSERVEAAWPLRLRLPSEFLVEAVRDGAPWPTVVPWPWETLG